MATVGTQNYISDVEELEDWLQYNEMSNSVCGGGVGW